MDLYWTMGLNFPWRPPSHTGWDWRHRQVASWEQFSQTNDNHSLRLTLAWQVNISLCGTGLKSKRVRRPGPLRITLQMLLLAAQVTEDTYLYIICSSDFWCLCGKCVCCSAPLCKYGEQGNDPAPCATRATFPGTGTRTLHRRDVLRIVNKINIKII